MEDSTNNFQQQYQQQQQQQHQHLLQHHFAAAGCSHPLINSTANNNNHPSSSSSSPLPTPPPPSYAVSTSLHWNPTILSTTTSSDTFCNKLYENDESSYQQQQQQQSCNNNLFPKTEEDMLSSFPSFTTLINSPNNNNNTHMMDNNSCSFNGYSLNNINPRGLMNFPQDNQSSTNYSRDDGSSGTPINNNNNWMMSNGHGHGHGFPSSSANILMQQLAGLGAASSPNHSTTSASTSSSSPRLGLNMQAMDLLGLNSLCFGNHLLHEDPFSTPLIGKNNTPNNKALAPTNGIAGTKRAARSSSSDQSKTSTANNTVANKKSLLKVSCPPLKVRKEKLGDRIAALHQLVSPFGKTDTASVLTEAIGYIQFLQDQIHTLCMPNNAKPSRNKPSKPFQMGAGEGGGGGSEEDGHDYGDSEIDIRSRGLCLVPVSWTSYISPNQFDASNTPFF